MLESVLPMLFYLFGIILFIVLIILGIRAIQLMDRAEKLMSNLEDKVNSLNGAFNVMNRLTTGIDLISSKVINSVALCIDKIFKRKKKEDDKNE